MILHAIYHKQFPFLIFFPLYALFGPWIHLKIGSSFFSGRLNLGKFGSKNLALPKISISGVPHATTEPEFRQIFLRQLREAPCEQD